MAGDGQEATAGTALPDSLVVEAADAYGNPVEGIEISWSVATGGGSVDPAVSTTDGDGRAWTRWTLGPTIGEHSVTAETTDGSGASPAQFRATATGDFVLRLDIGWAVLDSIHGVVADTGGLTHLGLRIEYPEPGTSTALSFAASDGDTVYEAVKPPTPYARIFLAAVESGELDKIATVLGVIDSLSTTRPGVVDLSVTDFAWTDAGWEVHPDYASDYAAGAFTVSKDRPDFEIPFTVRDPFQVGERPAWDALLIALNGRGGAGENPEGWREFFVQALNPDPGTAGESEHKSYPFLRSAAFDLPEGRYMVLPKGRFTVEWR